MQPTDQHKQFEKQGNHPNLWKSGAEVREQLGKILAADDVGLTDADGAEFLTQKAKTGHRGDFAGYEMAVVTGVDDASGSMKIDFTSVVPEATSAIDW